MSAGLTETDSMFATREAPWHRVGKVIESVGAVTAEEALIHAGMDWEVTLKPIYLDNEPWELPDKKAVIRTDLDGASGYLGTVGNYYQPVQNHEHFKFFDEVIGLGDAIYETAGTLWGGRVIWILARLPEYGGLKEDPIAKYILLSSSHDGTRATTMQETPVRVVCWNTLQFAMNQLMGQRYYARHTANSLNAKSARETLDLTEAYFLRFDQQVDRMLDATMTVIEVEDFIRDLYQFNPDKPEDKQHYLTRSAYEDTMDVYYTSPTLKKINGTAYGAFNAVTEYLDHIKTHKSVVGRDELVSLEKSFASTWGFENGASSTSALRQRAFDILNKGMESKILVPGVGL